MRHVALGRLAFCCATLSGVLEADASTPTEIPQSNVVYTIGVHEGRLVAGSLGTLPPDTFRTVPSEVTSPITTWPHSEEKIHPELVVLMADRDPEERVRVLVGFREDLVLPRFPDLVRDRPMDSAGNVAARKQVTALIIQLQEERDRRYDEYIVDLGPNISILERFWITPTLLVELPLSEVTQVARLSEVVHLEPEMSQIPPPSCCQVDDGKAYIGISFNNYQYAGGTVALLDTGVRATHTQLAGRIGLMRDCVVGTSPGCLGGSQQPGDGCNHGTRSAAIIAANSNQGTPYQGVTLATVNSFKVYNGCTLQRSAVQRGFQAALANLDKVIVAEIQDDIGETGTTTVAGDNAFDAGAVVIAANGNQGQVSAVGGPANGHKVIGTGARSLPTEAIMYQVNGPTSDGRIKPDVQAPTDTETASAASDTALASYGGTSGSTPYMAGAALRLRNTLLTLLGGTSVAPGQVYAFLIHHGRQPLINHVEGAGPIRLYRYAWRHFFGSVSLASGQQVDIPISVCGAEFSLLAAAIWWPENASSAHKRFELALLDPAGITRATGSHATSVFQKVELTSGIVHGTWKVRIKTISGPSGSQQVYWSAGYDSQIGCLPPIEL